MVVDALVQLSADAQQLLPHGGSLHVKLLCQAGGVAALAIAGVDKVATAVGQTIHALAQCLHLRGFVGWRVLLMKIEQVLCESFMQDAAVPIFLAQLVPDEVARDAAQPFPEIAVNVKGVQLAISLDEGILRKVVHPVRGNPERTDEYTQRGVVFLYQILKAFVANCPVHQPILSRPSEV